MPNLTDRYLAYLRFRLGLSENTCQAYYNDAKKLITWADEQGLDILKLNYNDMQNLLAQFYEQGIKARSMARSISAWRKFYEWLILEDFLTEDQNPTRLLDLPRIGTKLPIYLTVEQVDTMIEVARSMGGIEALRNVAIIETLFSCGLRVSELCALKYNDCFFEEGYVRIWGKGNKERIVPISQQAMDAICLLLRHPDRPSPKRGQEDIVFLSSRGKAISRITVFVLIRDLARLAGIKQEVSPHTLRHSFATALLTGGASLQAIQAMLGHEDISTTEIYAHLNKQQLREQVERYHPRNRQS